MNWIKYSTNLHDKPRVQRIADELGISRFDAAGRLCAVWVWADTMTDSGRIAFGSLKQVDRAAELEGFGEAMRKVGWVDQDGDDLVIPGWEDHHSASAKRRMDGAKRAAKNRQTTGKTQGRAQRAHENATKCAPREEKRREEKRRMLLLAQQQLLLLPKNQKPNQSQHREGKTNGPGRRSTPRSPT